jgi:4-hydroxy-tetrahydrodipicolinate reductase
MGREIEQVLIERGHNVALIIDKDNHDELTPDNLRRLKIDAAIEFSTPQTAFDNIATCLEAGIAVVSGTTGWTERLEEAQALCRSTGGALLYASNFSIGVNILFRINEQMARMMNKFPQYDVTIEEVHHIQKKDAPSGTAITLADGVTAALDRKSRWVGHTTTAADELEVTSVRRGTVQGIHTVTYESADDKLVLTHEAKSRRGFAQGAVAAAEFVAGKRGVFDMSDVLGF